MGSTSLGPCALEGRFVRLEPLRKNHASALTEVARKMDWGWLISQLRSRDDVDHRIADGLKAEERNEGYVFAVKLKRDNKVVGSTSYFGIVPQHKSVEIGYTWYAPDAWGSAVNPE